MKVQLHKFFSDHNIGNYALINAFTDDFGFPVGFNAGLVIYEQFPVKEDTTYEIDLKYVLDHTNEDDLVLYDSEEDYYQRSKAINGATFASESIIPIGTFEGNNLAIVNCIIDEVLDNFLFNAPDNIVLMYCSIGGVQLDVMLRFETAEERNKFEFEAGKYMTFIPKIEIWPEDGMPEVEDNSTN